MNFGLNRFFLGYLVAFFVVVGVLLLFLTGCGSSDSGGRPTVVTPPTPVTATISTASTELVEGSLDEIEIWVDITPQVNRRISVGLGFEGGAARNIDFEIDDTVLSFNPNQTRATTRLRTLDDWIAEGTESLTIRIQEGNSSTTAQTTPGTPSSVSLSIEDNADAPLTEIEKRGRAEIYVSTVASFTREMVTLEIRVLNLGAISASQTIASVTTNRLVQPGELGHVVEQISDITIPPIDARSIFVAETNLDLQRYAPNETYWILVRVDPPPEEDSEGRFRNRDLLGFTLNQNGEILVRCEPPDRARPNESEDPLFGHQWPLRNEGQSAFAAAGGTPEEDLRMSDVLATGTPTGDGVNVAVVDTGLEICHPDLAENVVDGGSFNFKANPENGKAWHNADFVDPYFPDSRGDHGTTVAGIIAADADNGLGIRGVAPAVNLFGFNFLSEQCCEEDALGGSNASPNSEQIDVFNMSYGTFGSQYNEPDNNIVRYGTSQLRRGLGAIYVKAAGNAFRSCLHFEHQVHALTGCSSSHGDSLNDLPYAIVVGALNATGGRASYSSAGSNLWVSAPAGEYGVSDPATVTTDQYGRERGYSSRNFPGLARNTSLDPFGDYYSNFNGTSAAAPHVSGVVALLLEEEPNLTWRDVKHILASTARRPGGLVNPSTDIRVVIGRELATFYRDWITNAAGFEFHNHFGFGVVDVDAAISFLRDGFMPDSLGDQSLTDWFTVSSDGLQIPDHDGAGIEQQLNLDLPTGTNIEAIQLHVAGSHENLVDLSIELESPSGTQSVLNPVFNETLAGQQTLDWRLLSNTFYGESPRGDWTLRIVDAAEGDVGTLSSWALRVWYGTHP
ncbi:MAG: S8 family serine peptidase [Gammaproteobacteria bacterium]|nr:S8 family serine peptidase [Gammaproteobacteria bacterium]